MTTTYNAYQLAGIADVSSPDSSTSPGALWLQRIASYVEDELNMDEDDVHEVADSLVPVYTHELWQVFVDLGAYQEDIADFGPIEDMGRGAAIALYMIAERLLTTLLEEKEETDTEDTDGDYC